MSSETKFDAYSDTRFSKNFMVMSTVALLVLSVISYISWSLLVISISGIDRYNNSLTDGIKEHFIFLFNSFKAYWSFYIEYHSLIKFSTKAFFMPKLFVCTVIPYGVLICLLWIFRVTIAEMRPYKKGESLHGPWCQKKT